MLITAALFAQLICMCTAAFFLFRMNGDTFAEAASYAIITVFMLLSFIRQISFIIGSPIISICMEAFFLIFSIILIYRYRSYVSSIFITLRNFRSSNSISFIFLVLCFLYMVIHTFLHVPKEFFNEFYRLSVYEKSGFFQLATASDFPAFLPINHLVLFEPYLRFSTGSGEGILCFLAYLSIGFSTYALARRYSWQPTAFTVAILVMSIPRLVVQAMHPGTQVISVAVALFCILAMYRTVELPNLTDLVLLVLGLFFCISENISSMIYAPILFVLSWVVLSRRHGIIAWKSLLTQNAWAFIFVIPTVIFSQSWLFLTNHFYKDSWSGAFSTIFFNTDGIQGALANFIRYLLESFYFTAPLDLFFEKVFNWSMAQPLQSLYDFFVRSFLGENGAAQAFDLTWMTDEMFSFGPVAFFLVLPALFYAMLKGPRRLKSVAIAFISYFYLVSLIFAWTPGTAELFEVFYVSAGFSMAFFFPPWRFTKKIKKNVQIAGCFLLFITLLTAS